MGVTLFGAWLGFMTIPDFDGSTALAGWVELSLAEVTLRGETLIGDTEIFYSFETGTDAGCFSSI